MAALSNVETVVQIASGPGGRGKRLHLERVAAPIAPRASAEERFWKAFRFPVLMKQFGGVTRCEFSPAAPFDLAATSGKQITVVQSQSKEVKRSLTRFKGTPYSGSYRHDGQLLVAGGAVPVVQVFDAESRNLLRRFGGSKTAPSSGHKAAVHVARFSLSLQHVLSGGDDRLAMLWDLETGDQSPLFTFDQHTDYIRCAASVPSSPHSWLTGAYDHTVRLWDSRAARAQALSIDHGAPVEDLLLFPSGTTLITAGGPVVRIWDLLAGGRLIKTLANHQKAVTCLAFDAAHTRLLTGSIDRFVKIYDLNSIADDSSSSSSSSSRASSTALTSAYTLAAGSDSSKSSLQVLHSLRYPAPVLSLALSPDDQHLAVGMSDGVLSIRTRPARSTTPTVPTTQRKVALKFHALGQHSIPSSSSSPSSSPSGGQSGMGGRQQGAESSDYLVGQRFLSKKVRPRLAPYERMLNKYQYYEALNAALATGNPLIVLSLMKELVRRASLKLALSGRDEADLLPLLRFVARYIRNPRYSGFITKVFALLLDIYSPVVGQSKEATALLLKIQFKMHEELQLQSEILKLMGVLDLYLATM